MAERERRDDWKGGIELAEVNEESCQKGGAQKWDQRVIKGNCKCPMWCDNPGDIRNLFESSFRKALGFLMSWPFNTGQDKT